MIQIQLIGPFRVYDANENELKLRSHRGLYALLALARGEPTPRREIINAIWPGVPTETAQNRFRVSLTSLRKILGDALIEEPDGIAFDPERVISDVGQVLHELNDIENEVDEDRESVRLQSLLAQFRLGLVTDLHEPWVDDYRSEWAETVLGAVRRLIKLARNQNAFRTIADACSVAFVYEPYEDEHWQHYLKAKMRLGESADSLREFTIARKHLQSDDGDFDEVTIELATAIRLGRHSPEPSLSKDFSFRESEFILALFASYLERDVFALEDAIQSQTYREEQDKYLDASIGLLHRVIDRIDPESTLYVTAKLQLVQAYCMQNNAKVALAHWDSIAHREMDHARRGLVLNLISFSHFQLRDYETAIAVNAQGIKELELAGDSFRARTSQVNRASYHWHMGEFEKADALYDDAIAACADAPGGRAKVIAAVAKINKGYSRVMQGRLTDALPLLEEALEVIQEQKQEVSISMGLAAIGSVRYVALGDDAALLQICSGIKMSYHHKHERATQIALDYVAMVFAHAGLHSTAVALIEFAEEWRERTSHQFSVAERILCDRTLKSCNGVSPSDEFPLDSDPKEILCAVIRLLRQVAMPDAGQLAHHA